MLKRILIKLSGEALAGESDHGFCDATIDSISADLQTALEAGTEISLVVGGGNFWRGRVGQNVMDRVRADQIGMLATVMNAIYMSEAFKRRGIRSAVMTPMPFANITDVYDKYRALALMADGIAVFHAAGLCHPFFSTDSVAALRGAELEVDCVLYTKNGVSGVYDKLPNKVPQNEPPAKMYKTLNYNTAIAKQLQFVDGAALNILIEANTPSFVFGLDEPNGIVKACNGENLNFGTILNSTVEEEFYVNSN
ncbi:MAG: UMP kinase [Defluviitaleaceae bacterium]|nr:UMP kinase [Defluviitaleaceae bacterium]